MCVCVCEYKIVSILGKSMSVKERVCVCVVFCVCGCGVCMGEGHEKEMSQWECLWERKRKKFFSQNKQHLHSPVKNITLKYRRPSHQACKLKKWLPIKCRLSQVKRISSWVYLREKCIPIKWTESQLSRKTGGLGKTDMMAEREIFNTWWTASKLKLRRNRMIKTDFLMVNPPDIKNACGNGVPSPSRLEGGGSPQCLYFYQFVLFLVPIV